MTKIPIPRINDSPWDFQQLARIWGQVISSPKGEEICFDLSQCDFLRPNALVFLGGLKHLAASFGAMVTFDLSGTSSWVRTNLEQCGFAEAMGFAVGPWSGNSIPYREDAEPNKDKIVEYLNDSWLGRGWMNVSAPLRDAIVGQMWELYANAFEHSGSTVGVLSCGQYFPKRRELELVVADFGVGIPTNARFATSSRISGAKSMEWAFERGTSSASATAGIARGIGLDLLKEFVRVSRGILEVYSHDGYARIDERGEIYEDSRAPFEATIVLVNLQCDETFYRLATEPNSQPYF